MGKIRWLHISDLHYDREMTGDWPVRQEDFPDKDIDFPGGGHYPQQS